MSFPFPFSAADEEKVAKGLKRCTKLRGPNMNAILPLMTPRREKLLFLAAILGVVIAGALYFSRNQEPRYGGKRLSEWVLGLTGDRLGISIEDTENAIHQIGTNGIPFLLKWMSDETPQSQFERSIDATASWLNKRFRTDFVLRAGHRAALAGGSRDAFLCVRKEAAVAVPGLVQILEGTNGSNSKYSAAQVLAWLGPSGIPHLVSALTNSNPAVRSAAVTGIGNSGTNAEPFIPLLIKALDDDPQVQIAAMHSLRILDLRQDLVISAMISKLQNGNRSDEIQAAVVLTSYGPLARRALPLLRAALAKVQSVGPVDAERVLRFAIMEINSQPETNAPAVVSPSQ